MHLPLSGFQFLHLDLVGGFNPFEKILVNLDHSLNFRRENKKSLKPPPSVVLIVGVIYNHIRSLDREGSGF